MLLYGSYCRVFLFGVFDGGGGGGGTAIDVRARGDIEEEEEHRGMGAPEESTARAAPEEVEAIQIERLQNARAVHQGL